MKKIVLFVFALVALIGLGSCGAKEYKLGMGVEVSTSSSTNATADKAGNAQVDATVAAVVLGSDGKIVACRIDAVQNKIAVSAEGAVTVPTTFKTKMELGSDYGMAGNQWSADNNGDGVIKEWNEQAKVFEQYVVGKTAAEVSSFSIKTLDNGYKISADDALLSAGCTIQITDFIAAVVKACNDDQAVTFSSGEFTLGVAASSFNDGSKNATADAAGAVQVYSDFAATVVAGGKIVAALNDAIQPKFAVSAAGALTASFTDTKRALKEKYGMAGNQWSADNNGDGVIKEWYEQSAIFSQYVVGKTGAEVSSLDIKTLDNGYKISNDDALLSAGCTIQITSIMEVVAKAFTNAR